MTTFYCPSCWGEVTMKDESCPHCRVQIATMLDQRDYVAKLIAALSHPEPTTPIRAAWILGRLRAEQAVTPLLEVLRGTADQYIKAAAVEALGQIGGPHVQATLRELAEHGPILLRRKAQEAIQLQVKR